MNIKDFNRHNGALHLDRPGYYVMIEKHADMTGKPTDLWMTDISGGEINICATYPRRKDAINGLEKLLRVFE